MGTFAPQSLPNWRRAVLKVGSSLLAGDGLALRPSGIIGSIAGAIIVTALWSWWKSRSASPVD